MDGGDGGGGGSKGDRERGKCASLRSRELWMTNNLWPSNAVYPWPCLFLLRLR